MKNLKKAVSALLILLLAFSLTACKPEIKPEPVQEVTETHAFSMFFGSNWQEDKLMAMLKSYEIETGNAIKPIVTNQSEDEVRALKNALEDDDAPLIFTVDGIAHGEELYNEGKLLNLLSIEKEDFAELSNRRGYALHSDDAPGLYGLAGEVNGYGIVLDRDVMVGFFGEEKADAAIEDLKRASFEEFEALVAAMSRHIKNPGGERIFLNGKAYAMLVERSEHLANVNGIFAISGSDVASYGEMLMNAALSLSFRSEEDVYLAEKAGTPEVAAELTTLAAIEYMQKSYRAYVRMLDLCTSHLSGLYSAGVRGEDFISEANYGQSSVRRAFMDGRAVFCLCESNEYSSLEKLNAKKAKRLAFIPIKVGGESDSPYGYPTSYVNGSLPMGIEYYYGINGNASDEEKMMAANFLVWLAKWEDGIDDALYHSLISYGGENMLLSFPIKGMPEDWRNEMLAEIITPYLQKKSWTGEDYEAIIAALSSAWVDELKWQ